MQKSDAFFEKHVIDPNGTPLIYHYTEVFDKNGGFSAHWHLNIEILQVTQGSAEIYINGAAYYLQPDNLFIINPNCIHNFTSTSDVTTYHCVIIDSLFCSYYGLNYVPQIFSPFVADPAIKMVYHQIVQEITLPPDNQQEGILKNLALVLVRYLYRTNLLDKDNYPEMNGKNADIVKQTITYISQNYDKKLSINDISQEINISKYYLCHLFKATTKQTINAYLNEFRCKQARLLLRNSELPINEISIQCGFQDPSYFTKNYRKLYKCLPSSERR